MNFLVIGVLFFLIMITLKIVFEFNLKKMKLIGKNEELDVVADKYPDNIEMCKEYLEILGNKDVIIEENKDNDASLYIAISNKILIANLRKSYTRIQTIAHECLHSVQDRKILLFNFFISNIFLVYFVLSLLLAFFFPNIQMVLLFILLLIGMSMYVVRAYLENDAMIKARYLAKDYLEKKKISDKNEIDRFIEEFDKINKVGIKAINYDLFCKVLNKNLLFCIFCIIINSIK